MYTCVFTYIYLSIHMYMCTCIRFNIHIHIHIHMHIYIHTYIHIKKLRETYKHIICIITYPNAFFAHLHIHIFGCAFFVYLTHIHIDLYTYIYILLTYKCATNFSRGRVVYTLRRCCLYIPYTLHILPTHVS